MPDYKLQSEITDLKRRMHAKEGDVLRAKRVLEDAKHVWEHIHTRASKLREELAREEREEADAKKNLDEAETLLKRSDKDREDTLGQLNHLYRELEREMEESKKQGR